MHFFNAQLVPLPKLSQTIEFPSYHNTRWRFLKPSNHIFMIYPNISKIPLDPGAAPIVTMPCTPRHPLRTILSLYFFSQCRIWQTCQTYFLQPLYFFLFFICQTHPSLILLIFQIFKNHFAINFGFFHITFNPFIFNIWDCKFICKLCVRY
jgi:hypothetical protein